MNEPINLSEWKPLRPQEVRGRLFTCGRPGRGTSTFGKNKKLVDDDTIKLWIKGLPEANVLHIVSLLGRKSDGFSEYGYYPFRSSKESGANPTFQQWLDEQHEQRFIVHEFPTIDAKGIPVDVLTAVTRQILDLIKNDNTVVIIDSAGAERTARVCEKIGYKKVRKQSQSVKS